MNIGQVSNNSIAIISLLVVWEITWKGFALWRAARNSSKIWFIILLLLNTVGILPILYLVFSKRPAK